MVELVYKNPSFKSYERHVIHHLETILWVVFNLWGTLKNNKRTLKNGPKYAKNLEMPWNSFAKRCWQPCFTLQKSTFNLKRHQNIKVWKIPAGDMKSIESGFGFSLELQGCGSPKNCFEICGPRTIICENFKSKALKLLRYSFWKTSFFTESKYVETLEHYHRSLVRISFKTKPQSENIKTIYILKLKEFLVNILQ